MLGNNDVRMTFLKIKDGKIVRRNKEGNDEEYKYVSGYLKGVSKRTANFNGEEVQQWCINLADEEDSSQVYCLQISYGNGVFLSLMNQMVNVPDLPNTRIKITAFLSKDGAYNRASLSYINESGNEIRPDWKYPSEDIPKVEKKYYEEFGKEMTSSLKRDQFTEDLVCEVMSNFPNNAENNNNQGNEADEAPKKEVEVPTSSIPVQKNAKKVEEKPVAEENGGGEDDDLPF